VRPWRQIVAGGAKGEIRENDAGEAFDIPSLSPLISVNEITLYLGFCPSSPLYTPGGWLGSTAQDTAADETASEAGRT
jgi:hypothetical protein